MNLFQSKMLLTNCHEKGTEQGSICQSKKNYFLRIFLSRLISSQQKNTLLLLCFGGNLNLWKFSSKIKDLRGFLFFVLRQEFCRLQVQIFNYDSKIAATDVSLIFQSRIMSCFANSPAFCQGCDDRQISEPCLFQKKMARQQHISGIRFRILMKFRPI